MSTNDYVDEVTGKVTHHSSSSTSAVGRRKGRQHMMFVWSALIFNTFSDLFGIRPATDISTRDCSSQMSGLAQGMCPQDGTKIVSSHLHPHSPIKIPKTPIPAMSYFYNGKPTSKMHFSAITSKRQQIGEKLQWTRNIIPGSAFQNPLYLWPTHAP